MISLIGRNNRCAPTRCEDGFSMIEMMITVVIISTCLVMALRVFTVCAAAVSESHITMLALEALGQKIDELCEECIMADGVEVSSSSDTIDTPRGKVSVTTNISEWIAPIKEEDEESVVEEEKEPEDTNLREVEFTAAWRSKGKERRIAVKTIMPAEEHRSEF